MAYAFSRTDIKDFREFIEWRMRHGFHARGFFVWPQETADGDWYYEVQISEATTRGLDRYRPGSTIESWEAIFAPLSDYQPRGLSIRGLQPPTYSGRNLLFYEEEKFFWDHHQAKRKRARPNPSMLTEELVALDDFITEVEKDEPVFMVEMPPSAGVREVKLYHTRDGRVESTWNMLTPQEVRQAQRGGVLDMQYVIRTRNGYGFDELSHGGTPNYRP